MVFINDRRDAFVNGEQNSLSLSSTCAAVVFALLCCQSGFNPRRRVYHVSSHIYTYLSAYGYSIATVVGSVSGSLTAERAVKADVCTCFYYLRTHALIHLLASLSCVGSALLVMVVVPAPNTPNRPLGESVTAVVDPRAA